MDKEKYSLNIGKGDYDANLFKSTFWHDCYFNSFHSCRKSKMTSDLQSEDINLTDITSTEAKKSFNIQYAYPLCSAELKPFVNYDICQEEVIMKNNYSRFLKHCRKQYVKDKIKIKKDVNKLPEYLVTLSNCEDPDPFFTGSFNWYYSGGVLDVIKLNEIDYVVRSIDNCLCLTNMRKTRKSIYLSSFEHRIFNVQSRSFGCDNFLNVRGKNNLQLIQLINESEIEENVIWSYCDKVPFTDFKLYDNQQLGFVNVLKKFNIANIETNKISFNYQFDSTSDNSSNFNTFQYIDQNNILFMDSSHLSLLDTRTVDSVNKFKLKLTPFELCDKLCNLIISKNDPTYIFVCTSHSLVKVDIRQQKPVKQWSHLLSAPPIFCESLLDSEEYVCLSSFKDRIILKSTIEETTLPVLIPNPLQTLQSISLTRPVVIENINERLKLSFNGLKLLTNNGGEIKILSSNSNGEVFCNRLTSGSNNDKNSNDFALKKMSKWIEGIEKNRKPKTLYATDIVEVSSIKQLHCKDILSDNLDKYTKDVPSNLEVSVDNNAYGMYAIWEEEPKETLDEMESIHKVTEWLNKE